MHQDTNFRKEAIKWHRHVISIVTDAAGLDIPVPTLVRVVVANLATTKAEKLTYRLNGEKGYYIGYGHQIKLRGGYTAI